MEKKRLVIASQLANRDAAGTKDGALTNCYAEQVLIGIQIVKRPGLYFHSNPGAGQSGTAGQGMFDFDGTVIAVIGDTLFINP